jgi:hypothetical protein
MAMTPELSAKWAFALGALALVVSCISLQRSLPDAAYRLDRSATGLYQNLRARDANLPVTPDARELANVASNFHLAIEDSHGREQLREQFRSVAAAYRLVNNQLDETELSTDERANVQHLTRALRELEAELELAEIDGPSQDRG